MVKDFRYILKRIIIGVGIALVLGFLRGGLIADTYAMTVSAVNEGNSSFILLPQSTWYMQKSLSGLWSGWGPGYVYFNFSVNKVAGTSTEPVVGVRSVLVANNSASFVCTFGSASSNNSTWEHQVYSAVCPVNLTDSGLVTATVNMQTVNGSYSTSYEGIIDGHFTFVNDSPNVNVNVDNSGSNANRDANFGNLINDNRANTQYITNNDNTNTNKIIDSQEEIKDAITDDTGGEVSSSWFEQFEDNSNNPVSSLLTMPITLLQSYMDGFDSSCSPVNLGSLYGTDIIIPCINIDQYLGSNVWSLVDSLFTIFMVYNIAMLCVSIYEGITSLDDEMQYLYSPQHVRGGRVGRGEMEGLY